ncbi:TRAFAC clade GTPase domain-containing protein [Providencia huaxiensis]|uniref:TRAFAC clade GTPase domain-containing protein n=1 Tax=Providencia huaxiensis TaxID=2027290 RepID=UPI0032DB71F6
MSGSCRHEGCTFDETGICTLGNVPTSCSNRLPLDDDEGTPLEASDYNDLAEQLGVPVLSEPIQSHTFGSKQSLGLDDINALMSKRYVNVVGVLGDPESGKTACLASLYLLLSHAKLDGWSFADSRSLTAFEEIARGAREWNNGLVPEQMTLHTELTDERSPGFLHLRLKRLSDGRKIDFALPDIPGEWTQALISNSQYERLDFLKSAETIWIVIDGRALKDQEKRHGTIARLGQLAGRLHTMFGGNIPRLLIVVTHRDSYTVDENISSRMQHELNRRGVAAAEIVEVAPFSDELDIVPAGFGIAELINITVNTPTRPLVFWKSSEQETSKREYLNYRRSI